MDGKKVLVYLERVAGRELSKVVRVVQLLHVRAVRQFGVIRGCPEICQAMGDSS